MLIKNGFKWFCIALTFSLYGCKSSTPVPIPANDDEKYSQQVIFHLDAGVPHGTVVTHPLNRKPLPGQHYRYKLPDGTSIDGFTDEKGLTVDITLIKSGDITLMLIDD